MNIVQGVCNKHNMAKVDRGGESICLRCESDATPKTGITVNVEDPGDAAMRDVLKKAGIAVPPNTGKAPMADVPMPARQRVAPLAGTPGIPADAKAAVDPGILKQIADVTLVSPKDSFVTKVELALGIMKSLPMPSDVKQFKAIQKIIAGMETLVGEK